MRCQHFINDCMSDARKGKKIIDYTRNLGSQPNVCDLNSETLFLEYFVDDCGKIKEFSRS